jgi:hypothetical protein
LTDTVDSTLSFSGISKEVFGKLQQKLSGLGIEMPATNEGVIGGSGVKAEYKWDGVEHFVISILEKPMFIPMSAITSGIVGAIKECGGKVE